jgi:RNA polymerase sigma-70 factor (ECF subfamily)
MDLLDDREIVRRCQCGQTQLMDVLIDRHKDSLYTLCLRLARNEPDADDLFQDTWMKAMKKLDTFSLERKFSTWLFAVCVNRYRDMYRWRKRRLRRMRHVASFGDIDGDAGAREVRDSRPDEHVMERERIDAVRDALDSLDDVHRLPIVLHYFHELSIEDIGRILDIPPGTVKSRLSNGRRLLKNSLEDAGHGRS